MSEKKEAKEAAVQIVLHTPSQEQQDVINSLLIDNQNCIVSAIPGSGKTTLIQNIVHAAPARDIMVLTFNEKLAKETKKKLNQVKSGKQNVFVSTLHAMMGSVVGRIVKNDLDFEEALHYIKDHGVVDNEQCSKYLNCSILIIDEVQDLKSLYFFFVRFLCTDFFLTRPENMNVMVSGDPKQVLYDFQRTGKADYRFLHLFDQITPNIAKPFRHHTLTKSFRSTKPICAFVNAIVPKMKISSKPPSSADANKVKLFVLNPYQDAPRVVYNQVRLLHDEHMVEYDEIMILAPSTNQRSPTIQITNYLIKKGIPIHVVRSGDLSDHSAKGESLRKGKVEVCTYHIAKGREAKAVICIALHPITGEYMGNSTYVALTRARDHLVVLLSYNKCNMSMLTKITEGLSDEDIDVTIMRKIPKTYTKTQQRSDYKLYAKNKVKIKKSENDMKKNNTQKPSFSFLAMEDVRRLTGLVNCEQVLSPEYTKEENDVYMEDMTCSFDGGDTFVNLTRIAGFTLSNAVEFRTNIRRSPSAARIVYQRILSKRSSDENRDKILKVCLAANTEISLPRKEGDSDDNHVLRRFKSFAMLAVAMDAANGYADKLEMVSNQFGFVMKQSLSFRYHTIVDILKEHFPRMFKGRTMPLWSHDKCFNANICTYDFTMVMMIHTPSVRDTDKLDAVATMCTRGQCKEVYLLNLFDGELFYLTLKNRNANQFISMAHACRSGDFDDGTADSKGISGISDVEFVALFTQGVHQAIEGQKMCERSVEEKKQEEMEQMSTFQSMDDCYMSSDEDMDMC